MIAITGEKVDGDAMIEALVDLADTALFIAGGLYEMKILPPALGSDKERL